MTGCTTLTFKQIFQCFTLLLVGAMLGACGDEGDSFLDRGIDEDTNKSIVSTQLIIGGQTEVTTLSPGQETSIAVRATYEDGSVFYLDPSDVTFEYERHHPMLVQTGASSAASPKDPEEVPFVVEGFMLKVPAHEDENVGVVAVYQNTRTAPVVVQVRNNVIEHLQLTPIEHLLVKGAKALFRLDAFYADGSSARLASDVLGGEWQVSDASVVSVDNGNGYFKALGAGQAVITYELNGLRSNEVAIKISGKMVTAIDVTPAQLNIAKGATGDVRAMATLSDGSKLDVTSSVSWSKHPAVSVDNHGSVMGVSVQANAPLSAAFNGIQSLPILVTVKAADINALVLSPSNTTVALLEQDHELTLEAQYTDGSKLEYSDVAGVVYELDTDIAHIDANGIIHPKSEGVAVVSAKAQDQHGHWVKSNAVALSVTASPLASITLHVDNSAIPQGVFGTIRAMGEYVDGRVEDISSRVSWQSSAPSVLTVVDGIVYGASVGQVDVTAYLGGVLSDSLSMEVTDAQLTSLSVYFASPKPDADGVVVLPVNLYGQALAIASFSNGSTHVVTEQVTWHSSNDAIVSVDAQGAFTARSKGNVSGYASFSAGGITKNSSIGDIKVTDSTPVRLDVLPSQVSLVKGLSAELHAVATYSDGHVADVTSAVGLSWTTQDASLARLSGADASTKVQGVGVGNTTIKAVWTNLEAQAKVSVEEKTLTGISLTPITQTLAKDSKAHLQVQGFYSDHTQHTITDSVSSFRSSDSRIATVDTIGEVSALASGSVTLSASYGGFEAKAQVVVPEAKVTALRVDGVSSIVAGTTQPLSAMAVFDDGSELDVTSAVDWQSNASSVVVNAGSVWAKDSSEPSVTITATFSGQQAQKTLSITSATLSSLSLTPSSVRIVEGAAQDFTLEATYSTGDKVDVSAQADWKSSNSTIAGFTPNTASLRASVPGDVTVTASYGDMSAQSVVYIADKTAAVESLRLSSSTLTLPEGGTSAIKVEASYSTDPGVFVDVTAQTAWQLDTDYALIGEGVVIARQAHSTPVRATAIYGGQQATLMLTITGTVVEPSVERIEIRVGAMNISKGSTTTLNVFAYYEDDSTTASNVTDQANISIDTNVAYTTNGKVYGYAQGTTNIDATYKGESAPQVKGFAVTDKAPASLQLTPSSQALPKGERSTYELTVFYTDRTTEVLDNGSTGVAWSIEPDSNTNVVPTSVTINQGVLTAREDSGDAMVKVVYRGLEATAKVTPTNATLEGIVLMDVASGTPLRPVKLHSGQSIYYLEVNGIYSDGTTPTLTSNITYHVDGDAVSMDDIGGWGMLVNGSRTANSALVYAESTQGNETLTTAKVPVTVTSSTVNSLSIAPSFDATKDLLKGTSYTLKAIAMLDDGSQHDVTSLVDWLSSDTSIGDMSSITKGLLNTKDDGGITITVSYGSAYSDTLAVTVADVALNSIVVTPEDDTMDAGTYQKYTATGHYSNGDTLDITNQVSWSVGHTAVATVDGKGDVTAVAPGTTTIHASKDGIDSQTSLAVSAVDEVTSVHIELDSAHSLAVGESAPLSAQLYFKDSANNDYDAAKRVRWVVEDQSIGYVLDGVWYARDVGDTKVYAIYGNKSSNKESAHVRL